jgi:hypothetical protein
MNLHEISTALGLEILSPRAASGPPAEVTAGYVSDLLSDVLANAPRRGVLVTVQVHMNVIAVAVHAELAAVIFAAGRRPEEDVRRKAEEEGIVLLGSKEPTFEVVGRLYALGLRGRPA